jgi:hypothetical protein
MDQDGKGIGQFFPYPGHIKLKTVIIAEPHREVKKHWLIMAKYTGS